MIGKIYTTDPRLIKFIDCPPTKARIISFEGCDLKIREGSNTISEISFCDLSLNQSDSLPGSDGPGTCGGFVKKSIVIPTNSNFILTAPEIAGDNGEVQFIIIKVKYPTSIPASERYITFEYKGWVGPIENMMILSGRAYTNGWDMTDYSSNIPAPPFSPSIQPTPASPDINFGGILLSNPLLENVQVEIMLFN